MAHNSVQQFLTCISHTADSDTASYLCQTGGKCHNNIPQSPYDTAHISAVPNKKDKKLILSKRFGDNQKILLEVFFFTSPAELLDTHSTAPPSL